MGSKKWKIQILTPVYKHFKGKYITTNLMDSKYSQDKRNGANRKQSDKRYRHKIFVLYASLVENKHIPFTNLAGRPLYKSLMKSNKKEKIEYKIVENKRISIQTVLSSYE